MPPQLYKGITYIRIHKRDLNNESLGDGIVFADTLTVQHSNGAYVYTIESIIQDPVNTDAYLLKVKADKSSAPANTVSALVVYEPDLIQDVTYDEYNAILNNAMSSGVSPIHYQVDRELVQPLPSNLDAIISGDAALAEVSNQLTSATGFVNGRYNGSRLKGLVVNKYVTNDISYGNNPVIESKTPYFGTFDLIRQTSDIGGVYQFNIPYVVNAQGDNLPTIDTKYLYNDMPLIFTEKQLVNSSVRFSELSPAREQRQQRKFTDTFQIFKGGVDVRTLAVSTSGSINSKGDTLTIRSGSFFPTLYFGEDTGVGNYTVEAINSGSDQYRTQVTKNTDHIVQYNQTYDPENRFNDVTSVYSLSPGEEAECDLQFNSTVLLAYDRDGFSWKPDMKTIVSQEISTDGGSNWSAIKEIVIPRFWTRGEVNEDQIPNNVYLLGYRKIDGISGIYLAVNLISGFRPFGGTNSHQVRTKVRYETSGNDDCFVHTKFEFTDANGIRLVNGLAGAAGLGVGAVAGAAGQAIAIGGLGALSATGTALALLTAPVLIGAGAVALTIGGILAFRNQYGRIKYKDTGINQNYVNVIIKEGLDPVYYSEFKVAQEIQPDATITLTAPPFSRSLGGPTSETASLGVPHGPIHYGSQGNPWLALSPEFKDARNKIQSSTDHEPLGFKDFTVPLTFQVGDQLKFEGNESKVHTIVEVVPQRADLPDNLKGNYLTMLKVDPPVPGATWVKNFQLRRFVQDPTKVLVKSNEEALSPNKILFTSSSLKGTLVPEYITDDLVNNFADYKQQLIAKGIIS